MAAMKHTCKILKEIRRTIVLAVMLFMGVAASTATKPVDATNTPSACDSLPVFEALVEGPFFPGGDQPLIEFLSENLHYPEEAAKDSIVGRVVVKFLIGHDGSVVDAVIEESCHPLLDSEALRVVKMLPKFVWPHKPLNEGAWFTLPLKFAIPEE